MYTPPSLRAASAYKTVGAQSSVDGADAHQLIVLLFDGLLQAINHASGALQRKDIATFTRQVGRAVRILDEGLKGVLDMQRGGEVAANMWALYDYCVRRLTQANLHNDADALAEVVRLIAPVADSWSQISDQAAAMAPEPTVTPVAMRPALTSGMAPRRMASAGAAAYAQGA